MNTSGGSGRGSISSLAWQPNGRRFASGNGKGELCLWNGINFQFTTLIDVEKEKQRWHVEHPPSSPSPSPSSSFFSAASPVDSKLPHVRLPTDRAGINDMQWAKSGEHFIMCQADGSFSMWDCNYALAHLQIQAHPGFAINSVAFNASDDCFVTASDDTTIVVWDARTFSKISSLRGVHHSAVNTVCWNGYRNLIAAGNRASKWKDVGDKDFFSWSAAGRSNGGGGGGGGGEGGILSLWDPRSSSKPEVIHRHDKTVSCVSWHCNGNWLLTAGDDRNIFLSDVRALRSSTPLATFAPSKPEDNAHNWIVSWHPQMENVFLSGSAVGTINYWLTTEPTPQAQMMHAHKGPIKAVAVHPLGHIVASGGFDMKTIFWSRNRPGDDLCDRFNVFSLPISVALAASTDVIDSGTRALSLFVLISLLLFCVIARLTGQDLSPLFVATHSHLEVHMAPVRTPISIPDLF